VLQSRVFVFSNDKSTEFKGFIQFITGINMSEKVTKVICLLLPVHQAKQVINSALLITLLAFLLAACASSTADPADTVEQYITAKVAGDRAALQRLLCSSMEADLDRESGSFDGVDATVEDMACARDGDANTVTCSGAIVAVYTGEEREFPLGTYNVVQEDGEWKWCGEAG
jgi:hypothetical protein